MKNYLVGAVLLLLALLSSTVAYRVQAQVTKPQQTCVWTYLQDSGDANIGKDGVVDMKGANWKKLSEEGWHMVSATIPDHRPPTFYFERCQ